MSASGDPNHQPKRVILRLRVKEFDGYHPEEFNHAIRAYLKFAGRPTEELDQKRHYAHIEPFQSAELHQTSFHIILDVEKDLLNDPNFETLQHEVYRVRRDKDGTLKVEQFRNPLEGQNFVKKMRRFTDTFYSWAK